MKNAKMKTTKIENSDQDLSPPPKKRRKKEKKKGYPPNRQKREIPSLGIRKYTYIIISTGK